jgi:hypothetical protein
MSDDILQGNFWLVRNEHNKQNVLKAVADIVPDDASPMAVQIKPYNPSKTEKQRAYLWGWVYAQAAKLLDDAGIAFPLVGNFERPATKDILHAMGQEAFLICGQISKKDGSLVNMYTSTEKLKRKEYWQYTENFTRLVFQVWGITIPLPPANSYYEQLAKEFSK